MNAEEIMQKLEQMSKDSRTDEIECFLTECMETARNTQEHGIYVLAGNELIKYYSAISNIRRAIDAAEDVLLLMEELNLQDTQHFAATLLNTAAAYNTSGMLQEADSCYRRALQIYEGTVNTEEKQAQVRTDLAILYLQAKRETEAKKQLQEAVSLFEKVSAQTDLHYTAALSGLGELSFQEGEWNNALSYYERALSLLKGQSDLKESYALLCENCAVVCAQLKDTIKQLQYEREAAEMRGRT